MLDSLDGVLRHDAGVTKFSEESRRDLNLELVETENLALRIHRLILLLILNFFALRWLVFDVNSRLLEQVSQSLIFRLNISW